ncbi:hypothetical protein ACOMHN_014426 [Nucella lapillus]
MTKTTSSALWQCPLCSEAWKKEWRYRRDVYVKKRRQLHAEKKLAAAGDSQHPAAKVPNWKFYQPMAFLDQFVASNSHTQARCIATSEPEVHWELPMSGRRGATYQKRPCTSAGSLRWCSVVPFYRTTY